MVIRRTSEDLEAQVTSIQSCMKRLAAFIEAHEFDAAAIEARELNILLQYTNIITNQLADET